ncbi:MAG TPA: prolyl oligopeptidase family serine peptidase [Caulobacteraceae bacterium]|jgi:dipeptidyl aminopeptidase/acylaminoacyl peptidase|nr:prolyl oligopeptidase family serine peptidase [Caulobacteraceae bacterium]
MSSLKFETLAADTYRRAATFLPQLLGPRLSGAVGDGYWIDDHRYFFCVSDIAGGQQRLAPSIVDARSGRVSPVLSVEALAALITRSGETEVLPAHLAAAQYDMPDADTLVVILGPDAFHIALAGPALVKTETFEPVPALHAPDGRLSCFLQDHDLWVRDRASGEARRLTSDGEAHHAYGAMPESGTAPLAARQSRMPAGLWSRDSQWFATHRIDERSLPEGALVEHVPAGNRRPAARIFKVRGPDADPPKTEFLAIHLPSGRVVRAAERLVASQAYSPFMFRQCWFTDECLYFFEWDRFSSAVALVAMDLGSGALRTVLAETAESGWIDLTANLLAQPMVQPLHGSGELIWYSQADGRGHLYLHDLASGALKHRITEGPWVVREIVHVDEAARRILFLASGFDGDRDPIQRRLCRVGFDGGGFETIFAADGDLAVKPNPVSGVDQLKPARPSYAPSGASADGRYVAASLGAVDLATRTLVIDTVTGEALEIARLNIDALWSAPKPELFEAVAADGVTRLVGAMFFPSDFDATKSYPLVDFIYPGPQTNWLTRRFPSVHGAQMQSVAELGLVGILLETRGMPGRDRAFHHAGKGRLLEPQLSDHAAVIAQLCERHAFLDLNRVGMFGMSGGGHATARAMFDYPELFKVGVALCGNHDNRNYVGTWLDRYGARPGDPERDAQANVTVAHKLMGKLLLIHGDMDDNVHPGHTLALSAALIAAGKDFDQLILPGVTHAVLSESPYAIQRIWSYFVRHLLGVEPPADFKLEWTAQGAAANRAMMLRDLA